MPTSRIPVGAAHDGENHSESISCQIFEGNLLLKHEAATAREIPQSGISKQGSGWFGSVMRRPDTTYVYAFVLGLIADLLSHTPVGLNALLLLLATFCLSRIFEVLDDSTAAMPIIAFAGTIFVFELVFAIVLMIFGYQGSVIDMLIQRVLPSTVLNTVIAAVLFLIMRRLPFAQQVNDAWQVPNTGRFR